MPYALSYPLWIYEEISVKNPSENWEIDSDVLDIENEYIRCKYSLDVDKGSAKIVSELKHLDDHVPANRLEEYHEIVDSVLLYETTELPVILK